MKTVGINEFVLRQVAPGAPNFGGTLIAALVMDYLRGLVETKLNNDESKEGYAPFCRIVTVMPDDLAKAGLVSEGKRPEEVRCPIALVTEENLSLLQSAMEARRPGEPEFFESWLPRAHVECLPAHHIDVILYTKEQLVCEAEAYTGSDFDIISVNAEMEVSAPMHPNTQWRNSMGPEAGGSGVEIDQDALDVAEAYWGPSAGKHVMVRS